MKNYYNNDDYSHKNYNRPEEMRSNHGLMKEFKKHTLVPPRERIAQLDTLIKSFSDPELKEV